MVDLLRVPAEQAAFRAARAGDLARLANRRVRQAAG